MEFKAKETKYNGRLYRSRLEARWAVVFDALKISFEYEPVRFESKPGEFDKIYTYLPDFYFPEFDLYGEVKPTKEKLFEEQDRISWAMDFNFTPMCSSNGLLLLGQIPFTNVINSGYAIAGGYLQYNGEGITLDNFAIAPSYKSKISLRGDCLDVSGWPDIPSDATVDLWFISFNDPNEKTLDCYDLHGALTLGRSARFDFDDSIPKMLKERRTVIGGGVRVDNRPGAASQKTLDDLKQFSGNGK